MENIKLVELLETVLGKGKRTARGNMSFFSPFISHHKPKLEVRTKPDENGDYTWHCWVSDERGKSIYSLFKKLNVHKSTINQLNKILDSGKYRNSNLDALDFGDSCEEHEVQLSLPSDYHPLWIYKKSYEYQAAMYYLKSRGISVFDIIRYRIGYAENGVYSNRIIIPSYDENGKLNYFVTRLYRPKEGVENYKNPVVSKDIVGFELLINWNEPIVLCESPFDAVAIKRNAIPLMGKTIPNRLKRKIIENKVNDIYICLDSDALKKSLEFAEQFMNEGINVYFVKLEDGDPSELGFQIMTNKINDAIELTFSMLVEMRLETLWN